MLAHAVNERLDELLAQHRVPYSRVLRTGRPTTGPLAALVNCSPPPGRPRPSGCPLSPRRPGGCWASSVAVHLVDPEQRHLVRMPAADSPGGARLSLDSTLAGRAFRTVRILLV